MARNEFAENGLRGNRRRFTRLYPCQRSGRQRHQLGKFCQPAGVISDNNRRPDRLGAPVPFGSAWQETLTRRQGRGEQERAKPVGNVRSDGYSALQDAAVITSLQQFNSLFRVES